MTLENRNSILACTALFILNFLLKFIHVSSTDIGLDEPFTIFNAQRDVSGILELTKTDNNPPLHLFIMHFWIKWFGNDLISVRFLSVFFSSLAAVVLFITTSRHFNFRTGIIASLLFTASNVQMFYAHDARVYSLFMFLSILNMNSFLNLIASKEVIDRKSFLVFSFINILLCYSHFFGFVILFVEVSICILIPEQRKHLTKLFTSVGIIIFSFIWYIPIIIDRFMITKAGNWIPFPLVSDLYTMIWRFSNVPVLAVLFLTISIIVLPFRWKALNGKSSNLLKIVIMLFLISYFILFFISFKIPVFIDRYLLFTSAYFYVIVSIALLNISKSAKWNSIAAFVFAFAMLATLDLKKGKKEHTKEMSEYVRQNSQSTTITIITPEWYDLNLTYYLKPNWFNDTDRFKDSMKENNFIAVNKAENIPDLNLTLPAILIDNSGQENSVRSFMQSNYEIGAEREFGGNLKVILFNPKH